LLKDLEHQAYNLEIHLYEYNILTVRPLEQEFMKLESTVACPSSVSYIQDFRPLTIELYK
jgi:hypothetical protein